MSAETAAIKGSTDSVAYMYILTGKVTVTGEVTKMDMVTSSKLLMKASSQPPLTPGKIIGKKGELKGEALAVKGAKVSGDGRFVRLQVPGLRPVMQLMLRGTLKTASGAPLPLEYYGTLNAVP